MWRVAGSGLRLLPEATRGRPDEGFERCPDAGFLLPKRVLYDRGAGRDLGQGLSQVRQRRVGDAAVRSRDDGDEAERWREGKSGDPFEWDRGGEQRYCHVEPG